MDWSGESYEVDVGLKQPDIEKISGRTKMKKSGNGQIYDFLINQIYLTNMQ